MQTDGDWRVAPSSASWLSTVESFGLHIRLYVRSTPKTIVPNLHMPTTFWFGNGIFWKECGPHPVPHPEGVPRGQLARMRGLDLATSRIVFALFLQGHDLRPGEHHAAASPILRPDALKRRLNDARSWRCQNQRTPPGEMNTPSFLNSLLAHARRWAG
jgi:hypothetical protein